MIDFPITELLDDSICLLWLARELHLSRQTVHTLRQRLQTNLNDTAPTGPMAGQTFEVDELYQERGGKKYAALRSERPAAASGQ